MKKQLFTKKPTLIKPLRYVRIRYMKKEDTKENEKFSKLFIINFYDNVLGF